MAVELILGGYEGLMASAILRAVNEYGEADDLTRLEIGLWMLDGFGRWWLERRGISAVSVVKALARQAAKRKKNNCRRKPGKDFERWQNESSRVF